MSSELLSLNRLDVEEALLNRAFPGTRIDRGAQAVVVPDFPLPPGWSHPTTDVLFLIPATYPGGCPDNICARPDLVTACGMTPGNSQGVQQHAGRPWLQLSWHIEEGNWRPTADPSSGSNLLTYLLGALTRFDEAS
jgi:hypothetical protein